MLSVQIEDENGPVTLADEIGSGTDGSAYDHPAEPDKLIKLWHDSTDEKRQKTEALIDSPPDLPGGLAWIAKPLQRVFSVPGGQLAGFTMAKASGTQLADVANPSSRPLGFQGYERRLRLVGKIAKAVAKLNADGYVLFDGLDPQNVMAGPELWLLDVDGWQIPSANGSVHHAEAVHAEICPPELMGSEISTVTLHEWHDAWVLGTVIVWVLTGHHPFDAKLKSPTGPALQDRIAEGIWPHARRARRRGVWPHPGAPLDLLHPAMRQLAVRCFDAGSKDVTARPRPVEWAAAVQQALSDKAFLGQIPRIEADAVRNQMAAFNAIPTGGFQRKGHLWRNPGKRRRVKTTIAVAATLLIAAIGVYFHAVVDHDKPRLVPPTGVVYEGTPRPTPELWKSALFPSDAVSNPHASRRPRKLDSHKSTPSTWKRLHDPYLRGVK